MKKILGWLRSGKAKRALPYLIMGVGLFVLVVAVFLRRLDPDFGWHLEAGRYILSHGVPAHDIFSYTAPNFPWVDHEWLSDVVTAVLYGVGGLWLVAGAFAAIWTAAIMLAARTRLWPAYMLGFTAIAADAVARPNAWTALFLALLLWLVRRGVRWPLVALFVLWANVHGGFVIGLAALAVAAVRDRRLWPVLAACVLATFANPYGPGLYVEIWRTIADPTLRSQIGEWEPMRIGVLNGFYICCFLFVVLATKWRYEFVLPALLLAGSVSSQRQFPLFVVVSLGLVAEGYQKAVKLLTIRPGWRRLLLPMLATALALVPVSKIVANPHNDLPEREVADLRATPCSGRVFNEYDFGGYMIWQLSGTKVYIDGRMPSWKDGPTDYLANFKRVLDDAGFAGAEFEKFNIGCAMLEKKHARLIKQLVAAGWRPTVMDAQAVLLRRP